MTLTDQCIDKDDPGCIIIVSIVNRNLRKTHFFFLDLVMIDSLLNPTYQVFCFVLFFFFCLFVWFYFGGLHVEDWDCHKWQKNWPVPMRGSRGGPGGPGPPSSAKKKKEGRKGKERKEKEKGKEKERQKKVRCHNLFFCAYIGLHWPMGGAGGSRPNKRRGNILKNMLFLCIKSYKLSFSFVKFNKEIHTL